MANSAKGECYVYQHTFADGSLYIGKGTGKRAHVMSQSKRGPLWNHTANKYGRPSVSYLKKGLSEELALFLEDEIIELFKERGIKLRNLARGGGAPQLGMKGPLSPSWGKKMPEHLVERMRKMYAGEGNPNYGRKHSDETKRIISENTKKTWLENRDRLAAINVGRKLTDEEKRKIGEGSKRIPREARERGWEKCRGQKRTPEQIERYKAGRAKRGPASDETKEKMSKSQWLKDHSVYSFVNDNGQVFVGTRSEIRRETGVDVSGLFRSKPKPEKVAKGWRLKEPE